MIATLIKQRISARFFEASLTAIIFPFNSTTCAQKLNSGNWILAFEINGFEVTWEYTHHPAATVGYKFKRNGRTLTYISDNEFLFGYLGRPHDLHLESETVAPHRPLVEFAMNSNLLVGEAQYMNAEYATKIGWGHSFLSNACLLARLSKANRWLVTHHDPAHDDNFLDTKLILILEILRSLAIELRCVTPAITSWNIGLSESVSRWLTELARKGRWQQWSASALPARDAMG